MAVGDGYHHRTLSQSVVDNAISSTSLGVYHVVRGSVGEHFSLDDGGKAAGGQPWSLIGFGKSDRPG
jgi:hypothetical protein